MNCQSYKRLSQALWFIKIKITFSYATRKIIFLLRPQASPKRSSLLKATYKKICTIDLLNQQLLYFFVCAHRGLLNYSVLLWVQVLVLKFTQNNVCNYNTMQLSAAWE